MDQQHKISPTEEAEEQNTTGSEDNDFVDDEDEVDQGPDGDLNSEDRSVTRLNDLRAAKNAIKEGPKLFNEEQLNQYLTNHGHIANQPVKGPGSLLHSIIDLVSEGDVKADYVNPLVQRLVSSYPELLQATNEHDQNPLYKAISYRVESVIKSMLDGCRPLSAKRSRQFLIGALEAPCEKDAKKTCLHLAFEKNLKSDLTRRLIKRAAPAALKAKDTHGKVPMHYAVAYIQCTVNRARSIELLLQKDTDEINRQYKLQPHAPVETFLDQQDKSGRSVYQEHLKSKAEFKKEMKALEEKEKEKEKEKEAAAGALGAGSQADETSAAGKGPKNISETVGDLRPGRKLTITPSGPMKAGRTRDQSHGHSRVLVVERERGKEARETIIGEREKARQYEREAAKQRELQGGQDEHPAGRQEAGTVKPVMGALDLSKEVPKSSVHPKPRQEEPQSPPPSNTGTKRVPIGHSKPAMPSKADAGVQAVSADILMALKLHYMRSRDMQRAVKFLHGENPDNIEIAFNTRSLPTQLDSENFGKTVGSDAKSGLQFDEVLQSVNFNDINVFTPGRRPNSKGDDQPPGRRDMEFFFDWLHTKGVRHILKLVVHEKGGDRGVHSDQSISNSLKSITVEKLDWQKEDLDPETICRISDEIETRIQPAGKIEVERYQFRDLTLRWSGKNAVLRAWSGHDGLPRVKDLALIQLHLPPLSRMSESHDWTRQKIIEFKTRLNKARSEMDTERHGTGPKKSPSPIEVIEISSQSGVSKAGDVSQQPVSNLKNAPSHRWISSTTEFASEVTAVWSNLLGKSYPDRAMDGILREDGEERQKIDTSMDPTSAPGKAVVVALIDDGVSAFDSFFNGRVKVGKSFDYHDGILEPAYASAAGHGTEMATMILKTCPMAQIYPIRLKIHKNVDTGHQLVLKDAALAIKEALDKRAAIISISWTVPAPTDQDTADTNLMKETLEIARKRKVLMFCSRRDHGQFTDTDLPAYWAGNGIFRIGAARHDGTIHIPAGPNSLIDFTFPGVDVISGTEFSRQGVAETDGSPAIIKTGSSIATAFASGLAAMVIYCFKISALTVPPNPLRVGGNDRERTIKMDQAKEIIEHEVMKGAFRNIGHVNEHGFIQVWDSFEKITKSLEEAKSVDEKHGCIADFCTNLVKRKLGQFDK